MKIRTLALLAAAGGWLGCESLGPIATEMANQYVANLQAPPPVPPPPAYAGGYVPYPGSYTTQPGGSPYGTPYGTPPPPPPPGYDTPPPPPPGGGYPQQPPQTANYNTEQGCYDAVQGKVAWSRSGATSWNADNVRRLCAGVTDTQARINCFTAEIQSHDNWSQGIATCTASAAAPTSGNPEQACYDAVQGKVAWNRGGATSWNATNVQRLCAGVASTTDIQSRISCFQGQIAAHDNWLTGINQCASGGAAPAAPPDPDDTEQGCFDAVQNRVAWNRAGSTAWNPANVQRLCAGVTNTQERISCFQGQIAAHDNWSQAIDACAGAPVVTIDRPALVLRKNMSYAVLGRSDEKTRFDCATVTDEYDQLMFGDVLANPGNFVSTIGGSINPEKLAGSQLGKLRLAGAHAGQGVGLLKTSKGALGKFLLAFTGTGASTRLEVIDATVYAGDAKGASTRLGRIALAPGSAVDLDPGGEGASTSEADAFDLGFRVGDDGQLVVESLGAAAVEFPTESLCGEAQASASAAGS